MDRVRSLRSDEIAVLVIADQSKVEKVHDHHRNDHEEYRADEVDQQRSHDRIGQPQPPCLLQELCVTFHLSIQVRVFGVSTNLPTRQSSRPSRQKSSEIKKPQTRRPGFLMRRGRRGSNPQPPDRQSGALTN